MLLKGLRWRFAKAVPGEVSKMERFSGRNTVNIQKAGSWSEDGLRG